MKVIDNKQKNIKKAAKMIIEAADKGAKVIVLPEMFNCPYENKKFIEYAETADGPTITQLRKLASNLNVYIIGGSIPEKGRKGIYNTSFIINPKGKIIGKHQKIHLFDINTKKVRFRESDTLKPGETPTIIETPLASIGIGICYDMRFPELSRIMTLKGAEILVFPGAFNMVTGPAHWKTIIRARAIDNQVFVVGVSPARNPKASYIVYGHSMISDPWGEIIYEADSKERVANVDINLSEIRKVRQELPLLENRRPDLYQKYNPST